MTQLSSTRRTVLTSAAALLATGCAMPAKSRQANVIHVAKDGSAPFTHIQAAIDAAPESGVWYIVIAPGVYDEKLLIARDNIVLMGQGPDKTIIRKSILREHWREAHPDDWGAAVVNIRANDVAMFGLTVHNTYGDETGDHSHQFAVRLMKGTRIITEECHFIAGGADTISLWERDNGMFYHRACRFEGYVDQVCPRGTAYIEDCDFFTRNDGDNPGWALWHEGSQREAQKLVVKNGRFDGEPGWQLGRRHYDAAFYLINPVFAQSMDDQPIFRVSYPGNPERERPNLWGDRVYISNATQAGAQFDWLANNWPADAPKPEDIDALWTFGGAWDPVAQSQRLRTMSAV